MGKINLIPEYIDEKILELRKEDKTIKEIREQIIEELNFKVSTGYIGNICKTLKETGNNINQGLKELNDAVEDEKKYEVANDYYIFYKDNEKYPIEISTVDNIFKDYSRHGTNMTGQEVMIKYKLKPVVWNLIKNRLSLYKSSNIISPYTLEHLPEDQIDDYIENGVNEAIQDKYKNKFERKHKNIKEREFVKYSNYYHKQQEFLNQLELVLKKYDPRKLNKYELAKIPKIKNNDTIDVSFSDLHMGKTGTDGIVSRIYKMTEYIKNRPEKNINLLFLGDLVESIAPGGMHPEQEKNMEINGFDLMMLTVRTLENMLLELYKAGKTVNFYGVGGNHDRISQQSEGDSDRTVALVIYEMISRGVLHTDIKVHILRENISVLYLDNFNYLLMHGERSDSKKAHSKPESFLRNHIKKHRDKETVLLHGDKHHLDMDECKDTTIIGVPSLCGQGEYDKKLDVHSKPGYIIIERNEDGTVDIYLKRLK